MQRLDQHWPLRLVSSFIAVVLLAQLLAVLLETEKHAWPFMNYPMYSVSLAEGDRVDVGHRVFAELDDGSEIAITWDSLGLDPDARSKFWLFRIWIVNGLLQPEAAARPWQGTTGASESRFASWSTRHRRTLGNTVDFIARSYETSHGRRIVQLRLEDTGAIITRRGLLLEDPVTVRIIEVDEVLGRVQK